MKALALAGALVVGALGVNAQDEDFLQALERAQRERPARLSSSARIAPDGEPGTPLVIHGQVLGTDGRPVAGAIVFAWHTDREGLYDRPGTLPHSWRLRGWAQTGADGGFEFRTIRPGSYPSSRVPAHVHFSLETREHGRLPGGELRFEDDPFVGAEERASSRRAGELGRVRPVRSVQGVDHVDVRIRADPNQR